MLVKKVDAATNASPRTEGEKIVAQPVPPPSSPKAALELAQSRRAGRQEKYQQA